MKEDSKNHKFILKFTKKEAWEFLRTFLPWRVWKKSRKLQKKIQKDPKRKEHWDSVVDEIDKMLAEGNLDEI